MLASGHIKADDLARAIERLEFAGIEVREEVVFGGLRVRTLDVVASHVAFGIRALEPAPRSVLTDAEVRNVACALRAVHDHFRPLLAPAEKNRWFAMQVELKLVGDARALWLKQARPHSFGEAVVPADCREL